MLDSSLGFNILVRSSILDSLSYKTYLTSGAIELTKVPRSFKVLSIIRSLVKDIFILLKNIYFV